MDAAFVLVVRKRANRRDAGATGPTGVTVAPTELDLGFVAGHHELWSTRDAGVQLSMWRPESAASDGPSAWRETDGVVTFVAGQLQAPGQWAPPHRWVDHLADLDARNSVSEVQRTIRGMFAALRVDDRGNGWLLADPFGFRCLYTVETDDVLVVASRAALAARALHSSPARDALHSCWHAYTGHHIGPATGYDGVRVVEPGGILVLRDGRPTWEHDPFVTHRRAGGESIGELAEIVLDEAADSLRAILDQGGPTPMIRLTGGKDSRLVVAAALRAGLADEFRYETIGFPGLVDADIATELAGRLGLDHQLRFVGMRSEVPYADRARRFVETTAGMANVWSADTATGADHLALTGIGGEGLRASAKLPHKAAAEVMARRSIEARRFNRLGLVRPDIAAALGEEFRTLVASEPEPSCPPFIRSHAHYLGHSLRFTRLGPRDETGGDPRAHPLYSHESIAAAMTMTPDECQSEILFAEAMRQASPVLVEHRFADHGWDARAQEYLGIPAPAAPAAQRAPATPPPKREAPPGAKAIGLMDAISAQPADERMAYLPHAFAAADNPVWDVIDRGRTLAATERCTTLDAVERAELFGAATAAMWLGADTSPAPLP